MPKDLTTPITTVIAEKLAAEFGTPIYVYDEAGLRQTAQELKATFSWAQGYRNYFAVKATPTPAILKILHEEGMGFDCSSRAELLMVQRMGLSGRDIFYTSNNTPKDDFELAVELDATVNIDDLTQLPVFIEALKGRHLSRAAARYNPGNLTTGNNIIGEPTEAKYGMSLDDLVKAFKVLKDQDIGELGLHTMVASNELKPEYFAQTAHILLDAIAEIEAKAGVTFSFVNIGGGFGLNYRPEQGKFDIEKASQLIRELFKARGKENSQLFTENGRYITGPNGYLLTRVRYIMQKYKTYIGVDASMHNLMRPGMYGAYHHITILGKEGNAAEHTVDIVGALCENNDKFAIDRKLPQAAEGDFMLIHDAGAHGHSMGFNYNGLLRSAEVLLRSDGTLQLIRQAESFEDYFQNIIWP
jgi:diaminopimelate decarboxylase